jgi:hypothetical protein
VRLQFQDVLSALQQLEARCDALAAREADLESEVGATQEAAKASDQARVNSVRFAPAAEQKAEQLDWP